MHRVPTATPPPPPPSPNQGRFTAGASSELQTLLEENDEFLIDFAYLEVGKQLGDGATSKVFDGFYKGKPVAVKVFTPYEVSRSEIMEMEREAAVTRAVRDHPNVVSFYGISVNPPYVSLVFELCSHGDLFSLLQREGVTWSWERRIRVAHAASGLVRLRTLGNGDCFFRAVAYAINNHTWDGVAETAAELRRDAAQYVAEDWDERGAEYRLRYPNDDVVAYLQQMGRGTEYALNAEVVAMARNLQRPIHVYVNSPYADYDRVIKIDNVTTGQEVQVYYNGVNHYEALGLPGASGDPAPTPRSGLRRCSTPGPSGRS